LNSIIQIQGAVDVFRGGAKILEMGTAIGGLSAIVVAGAGSWMMYHQQVEKAREELKKLNEEGRKFREREDKLRAESTAIGARSVADTTNSTLRPEERERRRRAEESEIAGRRAEQSTNDEQLSAAAIKARTAKITAERKQAEASKRESDAFYSLNPFAMPGQPGREAAEATKQKDLADKAAKDYQDLVAQRVAIGAQREADSQRVVDIAQSRGQERIDQLNRSREGGMSAGLKPTPLQEKIIQFGGPQNQILQRQQAADDALQFVAQSSRAMGAPVFTQKEVGGMYSSKIAEVQRELDTAFGALRDTVRHNAEENAKLRTELEAAHEK
jgi:hypothetical protein